MSRCLAAALAAALTTGTAVAQTPIDQLAPRSGVTVEGEVTHVFGNRFVVDDGTGSVLVETGPPWHHDISMEVGERVTVTGEPDEGGFDAFVIRRSDGDEIEIRPAEGPPPWSGSRRG
jgi:uncharacterized protein YdeI (BOF family)